MGEFPITPSARYHFIWYQLKEDTRQSPIDLEHFAFRDDARRGMRRVRRFRDSNLIVYYRPVHLVSSDLNIFEPFFYVAALMDRTQEIKKDLLLIRLVCNCGDTAVEDTIYGDLKIKSPSGRKEIHVKNLFVSRADSPKMFSAKFPMIDRDDPNTEYRHANS